MKRDDKIIIVLFTAIVTGLLIYGWAMERSKPQTYTRTVTREFRPGDTLTSKENGAFIIWDSTMPREMIVGYVSDSGTLILYYE